MTAQCNCQFRLPATVRVAYTIRVAGREEQRIGKFCPRCAQAMKDSGLAK